LKGTAGPSTALRSGRDDTSVCCLKFASRALRPFTILHSLLCEKHFQERSAELQIPPLRYLGFPVELGGVVALYAPFFTEGRTRGLSSAAWQEIRVRSGRDTTSVCCLKSASRTLRPFTTLHSVALRKTFAREVRGIDRQDKGTGRTSI
jgi:hypothetical protein